MASLDADSQFESVRQRMIIRHAVRGHRINMKIMVLGEDREGAWGRGGGLKGRGAVRCKTYAREIIFVPARVSRDFNLR